MVDQADGAGRTAGITIGRFYCLRDEDKVLRDALNSIGCEGKVARPGVMQNGLISPMTALGPIRPSQSASIMSGHCGQAGDLTTETKRRSCAGADIRG
jgi:hypothetical protein